MSKFIVKKVADDQYSFSFTGADGKELLASISYASAKSCETGIASARKNGVEDARYSVKAGEDGAFVLSLKSGNHQLIADGGKFATEDEAKKVIETIKAEIAAAEVADETVAAPEAAAAPVSEAPAAPAKKDVKAPVRFNASIKPEDFDWEAFEGGEISATDRAKASEAYDKTLSKIVENEVVEGEITAINKREVSVTIGGKSEGTIPAPEFRYNPDIKVGDKVEVFVESAEDRKGQLIISHRKARALKSWDRVNEAYENDEIVKGFVKTRTKGGMIVDVFGTEAFLPGSQIDIKPIRDYDVFVNQTIDFKIVKVNPEFHNVVVSHKALLEAEQEAKRKELIGKLEKGQILEGEVKNILNYGVFIDLGGVDGLIHITDLSWGRINHPEEVVTLGDRIKVVVLDFNEQQQKIALGLKQLTPHPWDNLDPNIKVGDKVKGKVILIADYGAFIEIEPGVEGLVHVSEMSWSPRLHSAQDFLKVGDEVEAQVLSIDREARKISLGMKQLTPNPWESIREKYPVGSQHKATVHNITNFGVFAELEDGVEGLIHISDLSWNKVKHPSEVVATGDVIDVQILEFDEEGHKLSLGRKQMVPNPWDEVEAKYPVGAVVEAVVESVTDKGANIKLEGEAEGFAFSRELVKEDGKSAVAGETLPFKVVELRRSTRRVILSHLRTYVEVKEKAAAAEAKKTQKVAKQVNASIEKTTLGDIDALAALKEKLEGNN